MPRYLLYHPESESLFEEFDTAQVDTILAGGEVEDVTGIYEYEFQFALEQKHGNQFNT